MKSNHSVLLVDPHSVKHGPPDVVQKQEGNLSAAYSKALDKRIDTYIASIKDVSKENWNAISTHYISNYGLLMLGGIFKDWGWKTQYINGDYYDGFNSFLADIVSFAKECDIICFTGTTPQFEEMRIACNIIKGSFPEKIYVYGGPHSYYFKKHREMIPFDIVCVGHNALESARFIKEIIETEKPKSTVYFDASGYVDCKKDFSLIPRNCLQETLLYSYTSFGCPNNCRYCIEHTFVNCVCFLSIREKIEEISFLVNEVGVRSVHLADSDIFIRPGFTQMLLSELERADIKCCFSVNTSPKTLTNFKTLSLIDRFVQLGLIEILIGTEYFSEDVLNAMKKNYSIQDFFNAISLLRKKHPELIISFYSLVGLPKESRDTVAQNVAWTRLFRDEGLFDFSFPKFFVPYPGTHVYEKPEEYDVTILHNRWQEYHRWALPRPLTISGYSDDFFLDELLTLYSACKI